jgi:predicted PurR-regulated permease PerM
VQDPSGLLGSDRIVLLGESPSVPEVPGLPPKRTWAEVPWRTISASVFVALATYLAYQTILDTVRIIAWIVMGGFFAIVLAPAVRRVQSRVGGRRGVATGIVVFSTLTVAIGVLAIFLFTVRTQLIAILSDLPGTISDAADGQGPVGTVLTRLHLANYAKNNESQLQDAANRLSSSSINIAATVFGALLSFVTITVITSLLLTQADALGKSLTGLLPERHRETAARTAKDAAGAISGYMVGNLLLSLIAGVASFVCLFALGVPSAFVIALWVAFADLIPLVGATLGAIVGVLAAFLQGTTPGIVALVFFVVYQQLENAVLYPTIMSRRVKVNPLVVLLSVLLAVEMFGFIGALLAVPFSGALQVIVKAIRVERRHEALIVPVARRTHRSRSGR